MAVSRADQINQTIKKSEIYSDFANSFQKHPITNQLVVLKNEDAVRQAFKNLILTNLGERLFSPFFGTNITGDLFEQVTPFVIEDLTKTIKVSAAQFEPRIFLQNVQIIDDSDKNGIRINITFSLINKTAPINLPIFIRRVR